MYFKQTQTYNDKCRFFTAVNTFSVVQNNKPVIDAINGLNKRRKTTSVSTFDFPTYTELPHNKILMVLNSFVDFSFDRGENICVTIYNFGASWVKNIKGNVICLNKQQIKDSVAYLLFNCFVTVGPQIFCQIIGIPTPFFAIFFLFFMKESG